MKDYQILPATSISNLTKEVKKLLDLGWMTQGGVAVTQTANGAFIMYQAMVLPK